MSTARKLQPVEQPNNPDHNSTKEKGPVELPSKEAPAPEILRQRPRQEKPMESGEKPSPEQSEAV